MAADSLNQNLQSLHDSLKSKDATEERSIGLVSDILQICLHELRDRDIDLCCSDIFDTDKGLISFLKKTSGNEYFTNTKSRILELLSSFIQKNDQKVVPYCLDIKDACLSIFFRERAAKLKNLAIPVLAKVLELLAASSFRGEVEVESLIEKFFSELTRSSKLTATVKQNVMILLGVIAEVFPEHMTMYASRFINMCITNLKTEMSTKTRKPEMSIIAGSLEALTSALTNFSQSSEEGSQWSKDVYRYTKMALDPDIEYSKYDVPRAGLKLFSRHAVLFASHYFDDYESLYGRLKCWSRHRNRDILHLGVQAVEAFLSQISIMLIKRSLEGKKEGTIFKFFVQEFRSIMSDNNSSSKEVSMAIKGYGQLAGPCRTFLSDDDVLFMFSEMINKSEQQFLGPLEDVDERLYSLPSYLEALASIIREVEEIPQTYLLTLERLLVMMMEKYPYINEKLRFVCIRSILWVYLSTRAKGSAFQQLLSSTVYQGLIRTFSHAPDVVTEEETPTPEDVQQQVTYKNYLNLWLGLMDSAKVKEFSAADISLEVRHKLSEIIYNEILSALLKILGKLDLTAGKETQSESDIKQETPVETVNGNASSDPVHGIQATRPKDQQVFINLVDFSRDLLPDHHVDLFHPWVFIFCHKIVLFSTDFPLVSGFYKLLSICMKIANKINFFKQTASANGDSQAMEVDVEPNQQVTACQLLMQKFAKEVLTRMKQYKDDLLASCLTFILSLPTEIIADQMMDVVPAVEITLRIGLSYLPLAMIALDALEYWSHHLPATILEPHLGTILPHLDNYLRTVDSGADDLDTDPTINMTSSKSGKGRKRLPVRMVRTNKESVDKTYESQLSLVKNRIIQYLGRLGGCVNCQLMARSEDDIHDTAVVWDTQKHLQFVVPFTDMKPTIYFDSFLPQILHLAASSSDRQTKVAACELLHSLVILSLGHSASATTERFSMASIYKHLFPVVLKLACDVEQVAKQLFEPLVMQIIHWFTSNKKGENPESMALLDAIYDGIIQSADTGLRDFSASCLREFLKWSMKHTSERAEQGAINVKSVLKRLFSYCRHPSAAKRLGAAVAFNNIYSVLREDDRLVDIYTFQILVNFVESLAIAHKDEKSLGTQEQTSTALTHLEKIIIKKAAILSKENRKLRTEPSEWSVVKLDICVRWLLRQTGRPHTQCRHMCMKLVCSLAPCIQGIKTAEGFFQTFLKNSEEKELHYISRFEGGGHKASTSSRGGIDKCPSMPQISEKFSLTGALDWFDLLLAALDCYTWVFGENLLSPKDLFKDLRKTQVFNALCYFVDKVAMTTLNDVPKLFGECSASFYFTPKEVDDYNRAKCTVVIRVFNFLTAAVARSGKDLTKVIPSEVLGRSTWSLLCYCVVHPGTVGFNLGDIDIMKQLPKEMEQILKVLCKLLPTNITSTLLDVFTEILVDDRDLKKQIPIDFENPNLRSVQLQQLIQGYRQLLCSGVLTHIMKGQAVQKMAVDMLNNTFMGLIKEDGNVKSEVELPPSNKAVAKELLDLALSLGIADKDLTTKLLCSDPVEGPSKGLTQGHGDLFFSSFQAQVCVYAVENPTGLIPCLMSHATSDPRKVSHLLTAILDYSSREKALRKMYGQKLVQTVLTQASTLTSWCQSSTDLQSMTILILTKLLLIDSKLTTDQSAPWFTTIFTCYTNCILDSRTNLAFKCRVLDALPFFVTNNEDFDKKLKASLDRLITDYFPLSSREFPTGSPQYKDYTTAIDRLLNAMELSGSSILLEVVLSIICRENDHSYGNTIAEALDRFIKRLSPDKQKAAIDVAYSNIFLKETFPKDIRTTALVKVVLPMLRKCHPTALIEFYTAHMAALVVTLEAPKAKGSASLEKQVLEKTACFRLLDIMYSRFNKEQLFSKNSTLNRIFCQCKNVNADTGKEMTQAVMKSAHNTKGEDMRGETTLVEERRVCHCAAYNLLISVISCTQTDQKFYKAFLFTDKEEKGQYVFENLIDKDKVYEFPVELSSPMERKKQFVSLRKEVKETREDDGYADSAGSSFHLASQYLADSSLHDDLSVYDFSMASGTSQSTGGPKKERSREKVEMFPSGVDNQDPVAMVEDEFVELEQDELNGHECMATLVALLHHMKAADIIPPDASTTLPDFMTELLSKLKSSKTRVNVKLFIGKLIINASSVFQPYAQHWIKPLCHLILSGSCGSQGLNYYIVDLLLTMLSWHKAAIPQDTSEEKSMCSRLVEFVMKNIYSDTRAIFRTNIELLKTLLECWKDRINLPYNIIYNLLAEGKNEVKMSQSPAIQILGLVLACKLPPYGPSAPVDRDRYFNIISHYMNHQYKAVYAAAAEVTGMTLLYLAQKEGEKEGHFHDHVTSLLSSMSQSKPDVFITCVHRLHRHHPPICNRFVNKLLYMLPSLYGEFRSLCLEVIHGRLDLLENPYLELSSKGLDSFLKHRDEDTQLMSLKIVKSMMGKLQPSELSHLLSWITAFHNHPSVACRMVMYEILTWVYDNYRDREDAEAESMLQMTKEGLLRGLGDSDMACRLHIQNFWSSESRLPTGTLDRLVAMLMAMYVPSTERQYLSYATNLLLEMTSKSPDYQETIFSNSLSNCKFTDYNVKSSWKQRHAAMTPLFASTMATGSLLDDSMNGEVQATADVQQFTQTQEGGPFNWLTQSSLDTYTDFSTAGPSDQQSALFSVGTMETQARIGLKRPMIRPRSGNRNNAGAGSSKTGLKPAITDEESEILRLRRRYVRDEEASRIYFARKQARLKEMRESVRKEQKLRRENQVTMYRKYRIGELPDIQIQYSYVIAPLQAVAHRDETIARLLFTHLFKAIFAKKDQTTEEHGMEEAVSIINKSFLTILTTSTFYHSPFIGAILDILHDLASELDAESSSIGTSATVSNLQPLGISLLEKKLIIHNPDAGRASKRSKTDTLTVSSDVTMWIELARLYKSVEQYDVLLGIFAGKIQTQDLTQRAVQYEAQGDFMKAWKHYEEALECGDWPSGTPLEAEVDMWDDCRLECLNKLSQWKVLAEVSSGRHGNTDLYNIWEDTYDQEHYLPFVMRSKVKLVLHGDSEQQDLLTFIDKSLKDPNYKHLLESRYCQELAMLYIWQQDYNLARHYTSMAIDRFKQDWKSTGPLMINNRERLLQTLQGLVEMQEFLHFMSNSGNLTSVSGANNLAEVWMKRSPHRQLDNTCIWDDIITNRSVFLDHISSSLATVKENTQGAMDTSMEDMFADIKLKFQLQMAESCTIQNNFKLALQILTTTKNDCKSSGQEDLVLHWRHLYTTTHHKKATSLLSPWTDETYNSILSTIDLMDKCQESVVLKEVPSLGRRHYVLSGQTYQYIVHGLRNTSDLDLLNDKNRKKLLVLAEANSLDPVQMSENLVTKGYSLIKQSLEYHGNKNHSMYQYGLEEAYLSVAKYCNQFLHLMEDEEISLSKDLVKTFPNTIVHCLLNAMKLDSQEARQRFPRLLQLIELYPECSAIFKEKSGQVPSWMFLLWSSQLMTLLDKPQAPAVQDLVLDLANNYPQAIIYHFKLSSDSYRFGTSIEDRRQQAFIKRLEEALNEERTPLVRRFISALEQFGQPDAIYKDFTEDVIRVYKGRNSSNKTKMVEMYQDMYAQLFDSGRRSARSLQEDEDLFATTSVTSDSMWDTCVYKKKFSDKYKKDFDNYFGKDGTKLLKMSFKEFVGHYQKISENLRDDVNGDGRRRTKPLLAPPHSLKEYSHWMARFNPSVDGPGLEIPGQYTGLCKPLPEYHVKIAGFDHRVSVMPSIRKPKKIIIRGNDERDYPYMVKSGEDLRQDQRIEQLFFLMNQVFHHDPACSQRKLSLHTYQVIPMTSRVGLIEWVSKTTTLKNFLYGSLSHAEQEFLARKSPMDQHREWINKLGVNVDKKPAPAYAKMYQKYTKTETVREFRLKEAMLPWDLMRRAFVEHSTSPEAFHVLRCKMAVSHSLICICQYILGIGDRHLSNFMVSLTSGEMVGIDFGHAFGSATQFLPIPELMPMRLTRQLRNLMLPLQEKGLMESTMTFALRALREDHELLLSTMDIFVKEPSLDWLVNAEKQIQSSYSEEDLDSEDLAWYPKQKIAFMKRKLKGENPCYITRDELKLGHAKKDIFGPCESVVLGDMEDDKRAQLPQYNLSVEDQVTALIDQATDPNILGRTYHGWEPWM